MPKSTADSSGSPGRLRVGTCSWTDRTMVEAWYPPAVRSAADRLRYYAQHFDTVEVDSTFYGLPSERNAELWTQRTPPGFVFHVKAFGMMTRHGVRPDRLPKALRERYAFETDEKGRIVHPADELRAEVFGWFRSALEPLRSAGKLGVILLQFPPYFTAKEKNRSYIAEAAELLSPDLVAVEFRHASWVAHDELARTLSFLSERGLAYVCVDEPRLDTATVLPPVTAATTGTAYVRFHGRNTETWHARTSTAAERFKYFYSDEELREWASPLQQLRSEAETTYAMFNNCYADYAPRNARRLMTLLDLIEEGGGE